MRTEAQALVPADAGPYSCCITLAALHGAVLNCCLQSQRLLLDIGTELLEAYKIPGQFVQVRCSNIPVHLQAWGYPTGRYVALDSANAWTVRRQIRVGDSKPGFYAIASPPDPNNQGVVELLVKAVPDSTAQLLANSKDGDNLLTHYDSWC